MHTIHFKRDIIYMNNIKRIITKEEMQVSIHASVRYYECLLAYNITNSHL